MSRSVRIKDHHAEQRLFEGRAIAAAVIMLVALGSVIARLVWLQVVQYDYFADLSQGNRIKIEPIPPNRGLILDRNGLPLATNAPSYQLELTREQVDDIDATLVGLAQLGLLDNADIPSLKKDIRSRRIFEAVPVKLQLTDEELARFAARRYQFPGVEIRPRLTRYYPLGASSVHAIGYVGAISEEDEKTLDLNEYAGTTLTGKSGVERAYETRAARARGLPAAAGQRAGPQRRAHRQGSGEARAAGAGRRQRSVPDHRPARAAGRRGSAARPASVGGRDRSRRTAT